MRRSVDPADHSLQEKESCQEAEAGGHLQPRKAAGIEWALCICLHGHEAAWQDNDQQELLARVAQADGLTKEGYLAAYVDAGWGGIPELYQCARTYGVCFDIWNGQGQHIACVGSRHARVQGHLCYEQSHYAVIKNPQEEVYSSGIPNWRFARRGGGGGSDSRSPTTGPSAGVPIKLVSRTERLEKEREEELRRTDTRPPLARKRKDPPVDPPSRSSLSPPLRDAPEPPPEPKMQRSEKSKQKAKAKDEKKKSRREEAEKAVKVESKAMPHKRPLLEQKLEEPSVDGSQGKETQKTGKGTKLRAEVATGTAASTRPGDALPSNTEPRTKKAANQEFSEDHPYYRCILKTATGSICSLCGKWLDSAHLASVKHRKNYESYLEYSEENRQIFARSCVTWALENMVQPARGGAAASSTNAPESVSSDGGGFDEEIGYCNSSDDYEELQAWLEEQHNMAADRELGDDETLAHNLRLLMGGEVAQS